MRDGLMGRVHSALRSLSPGYFALVMATGVVSIGMHVNRRPVLSRILLAVTAVSFVVLLLLTLWRLISHRHELVEDFTHPLSGFGFYSFVAAANVLGVRLVVDGLYRVALGLLLASGLAWVLRGYAVPWTTHLGRGEHPIVAAANGTWFMWAVAGQSIAVAAATLEPHWPGVPLALGAVIAWSLGVFLYAVDGVFVAMRLLAYDFSASDLTPPYWVAMGAAAITVLAGAKVATMVHDPSLHAMDTWVGSCVLVFWAVATWLMPALFAMGWWRHATHAIPLRYDANMWCIVFPLGMYAVACDYLARSDGLTLFHSIGVVWIWVALAAWALAIAGMVVHIVQTVVLDHPVEDEV